LLLHAEKELENQGKKGISFLISDKNNEHIKNLIAMLRVRRFIHLLMKTLDLKYDNKNFNKITSDIQSAKKRFTALEDRGLEYKELYP
jgi:translation elongation factor EF-1alpha